ncbi:MAG: hypothetical protein IJR41_04865 [Atopobiaceae bacterium]|nr:hypothetical protein [Atopobiaceae bacterium]
MAIAPYASVQDLEDGWRGLTSTEESIAGVLLDRASALLCEEIGDIELTENQEEIARYIVCDMVRYSFLGGSLGATPVLEDGLSDTVWESDLEGGSLLVTDRHLAMLGLSRKKAGYHGIH